MQGTAESSGRQPKRHKVIVAATTSASLTSTTTTTLGQHASISPLAEHSPLRRRSGSARVQCAPLLQASHSLRGQARVAIQYAAFSHLCSLGLVSLPYPALVESEEQHPHPFAPPELKQSFGDFVKKFQSSSSSTSPSSPSPSPSAGAPPKKKAGASGPVYEEFWHAPQRLWQRDLADWEIALVQVSLE